MGWGLDMVNRVDGAKEYDKIITIFCYPVTHKRTEGQTPGRSPAPKADRSERLTEQEKLWAAVQQNAWNGAGHGYLVIEKGIGIRVGYIDYMNNEFKKNIIK